MRDPEQLLAILRRYGDDGPGIFVETGTFHGKTTLAALRWFGEVHTIELHPQWYADAQRDLSPLGVRCYQGDSAGWLPVLAREITAPALFYLDAHWFHRKVKGVAGRELPLPLWAELEAIAQRPYADIVVVDDVHCFGTEEPTREWLDVSLERIAGYFPRHREAVILGDQAVVYR